MVKEIKINELKLHKALDAFREYSKKAVAKNDASDRSERKRYFYNLFSKDFDEFTFSEIIKRLWASQIWSNKEYLVTKIIKDNGIEKLKAEFSKVISEKTTPGERYERFLGRIKGMGPSMVTELICYANPKEAGIWNDKARKALMWLEVKDLPYSKYKINGREYDEFNKFLSELAVVLSKSYREIDLLFVDYFLWEIWDKFVKNQQGVDQVKLVAKNVSRHDEVRDRIAAIGSWLGFETETEKLVAPGAKVDAVWRAKVANLGEVYYVFEVQDRGSIDSLILNLHRAQSKPTVQKLIAVSDAEQLIKIQKEVSTMPENFRRAIAFWESDEVEKVYQSLEQITDSIKGLNLLEE